MNKNISNKLIESAVKKPVKSLLNPVDNLLVLVLVINKDTGKVLDIVSKPSLINSLLEINLTKTGQSALLAQK